MNARCAIRYSSDLENWPKTVGEITLTNGLATFSDKSIKGVGRRFYRTESASENGYPPSATALGFVWIDLSQGLSMFANQWHHPDGNTLNRILPRFPVGSCLYKWDPDRDRFLCSTFLEDSGWTPDALLVPGEGAYLRLPQPVRFPMIGEVPQGALLHEIPDGWSIHGSMKPVPRGLTSGLNYPPMQGEKVFLFDTASGHFEQFTFNGIYNVWLPREPEIRSGEAFWFHRSGQTTKEWIETTWTHPTAP